LTGLISTLATIRRLAIPYFRSEDRLAGCLLLASVIALELAYVGLTVLNTQWYNRFYTALQDYDWDAFVGELLFFFGLCVGFVVVVAYQTYLQQWLLIRWRGWMTARYLADWLDHGNHYRMQVLGDGADNPDQRIAEDIKEFIDKGLDIGIGLLSACVSLASFVALLWGLSAESPLHLFGGEWHIPGYLVWAALLYAAFGTYLTNLIGRALIGLNFDQQHYEADFRFSLVRVRENSEQIALLSGEPAERARLLELFAAIATNWRAIMTCQRNLDFFTSGYSQISTVFPFLVASPAYFARAFQLGGLMQTVSAFGRVQDALSFFITIYAKLAEWRAVVDRLAGFERAVALGRAAAAADPKVAVLRRREAVGIEIDGLDVHLPDGRSLVAADRVTIAPDASVLLTGPSGSGKSTLFRAIAGIWPFGSGIVAVAAEADIMVLPQRPTCRSARCSPP
jgi:vitamin B12/bleomycin/antimicrobial peptide transport system ATP-binding/permease protein